MMHKFLIFLIQFPPLSKAGKGNEKQRVETSEYSLGIKTEKAMMLRAFEATRGFGCVTHADALGQHPDQSVGTCTFCNFMQQIV